MSADLELNCANSWPVLYAPLAPNSIAARDATVRSVASSKRFKNKLGLYAKRATVRTKFHHNYLFFLTYNNQGRFRTDPRHCKQFSLRKWTELNRNSLMVIKVKQTKKKSRSTRRLSLFLLHIQPVCRLTTDQRPTSTKVPMALARAMCWNHLRYPSEWIY